MSLRCQRRTEPRPWLTIKHKKFGEDRTYSSEDMIAHKHAHTHTERETDRHAHHNTPLPIGDGVKKTSRNRARLHVDDHLSIERALHIDREASEQHGG